MNCLKFKEDRDETCYDPIQFRLGEYHYVYTKGLILTEVWILQSKSIA